MTIRVPGWIHTRAREGTTMDGGYISPPHHRNLIARGKIKLLKILTKATGYLYILLSGRRSTCQLVSVKNGKAVYREEQSYISIYLLAWRGEQFVRSNPVALQPDEKVTRHIVRYPSIDTARQVQRSEVLARIADYGQAQRRVDLATFLATYGGKDRERLFVQLKQRILDRYPSTHMIDVGLCHGDLTSKNIGFQSDGKMVFIDWDDAFLYVTCYDEIYFLLSEHFTESKVDLTYTNVLARLGLGSKRLVLGDAHRFISSAIRRNLNPLESALFLLRYCRSVNELDGVSGILLGDVDEVVW
jgi:hypothetical protein